MTTPPAVATLPGSLQEIEALARTRVEPGAWLYLDAGAADEVTLRRNRSAFDGIRLAPRVLIDVSKLDLSTTLLGQSLAHPVMVAPMAYHRLFHPGGEAATARGAAAAGAAFVLSTFSSTSLDEVAGAARAGFWFQLYVQRDRGVTRAVIERAEAAGARALVITVDTPVLGTRERERRSGFQLPPGLSIEPLAGLAGADLGHQVAAGSIYSPLLDPSLSWESLAWIRSVCRLPIVLKGVLSPEDAAQAVSAGAGALIVSNHGGRNLDTAPATIEALPRVAEAVAGRIPLLLDGGIRRGTDIAKALALGASAVLVGRPVLWGLAAGGEEGVRRVLELLRLELEAAMALLGTPGLADIGPQVIWRE